MSAPQLDGDSVQLRGFLMLLEEKQAMKCRPPGDSARLTDEEREWCGQVLQDFEPLLKKTARQVCATPGFFETNRDDVAQELRLKLVTKLLKYDAFRGALAAFVKMVVENDARSIMRQRRAAKRSWACERRLLNDASDDKGPGTFSNLCEDKRRPRPTSHTDVQLDV